MIHHGDCLDILPTLDDESVDACATDPPYGISFMGKDWDHGVPGEAYWREVNRVLKPGGHLLAFGGTRTHHRLMVAIEDAGFEIRDCLMWLYGSGFPKSLDVSKAIDKAAGVDRESSGTKRNDTSNAYSDTGALRCLTCGNSRNGTSCQCLPLPPATDAAQQWAGWGTALKPAWEPIILARKPLAGTVAQNTLAHGTAGLNIDATRIGYASDADLAFTQRTSPPGAPVFTNSKYGTNRPEGIVNPTGRWPANVVLSHEPECQEVGTKRVKGNKPTPTQRNVRTGPSYKFNSGMGDWNPNNHAAPNGYADADGAETVAAWECTETCAVRLLDEQSGERKGNNGIRGTFGGGRHGGQFAGGGKTHQREYDFPGYGDTGGASRFLYTAKASRSERGAYNDHPTVKPLALMRWLVRLVTPSGGVVLDPFLGSGTTALACQREGFACIGIERDEHSVEIALRRLEQTTLPLDVAI